MWPMLREFGKVLGVVAVRIFSCFKGLKHKPKVSESNHVVGRMGESRSEANQTLASVVSMPIGAPVTDMRTGESQRTLRQISERGRLMVINALSIANARASECNESLSSMLEISLQLDNDLGLVKAEEGSRAAKAIEEVAAEIDKARNAVHAKELAVFRCNIEKAYTKLRATVDEKKMQRRTGRAKKTIPETRESRRPSPTGRTESGAEPEKMNFAAEKPIEGLADTLVEAMRGVVDGVAPRLASAVQHLRDWDISELSTDFGGDGALRRLVIGMVDVVSIVEYGDANNCSPQRRKAIMRLHAFYEKNGATLRSIKATKLTKEPPSNRDEFTRLIEQGFELMQAVVNSPE